MKKLNRILKDLLLRTRVSQLLQPVSSLFEFIYLLNALIKWIYSNKENMLLNDFFTFSRNHKKRFRGFEKVVEHFGLNHSEFIYLEFGVASGESFRWWLSQNNNVNSSFHGFDTFEGLPENWGAFYGKGAMKFDLPDIKDTRAHFYRGLFQNTLNPFIINNRKVLKEKRLVIHLDADLFSSTIYTLSQLYPYLKKGDILMFDEFNVPRHEFKAFKIFTECFYVKLSPIYAVNNYYQSGFIID
jgi:hypothetical protein